VPSVGCKTVNNTYIFLFFERLFLSSGKWQRLRTGATVLYTLFFWNRYGILLIIQNLVTLNKASEKKEVELRREIERMNCFFFLLGFGSSSYVLCASSFLNLVIFWQYRMQWMDGWTIQPERAKKLRHKETSSSSQDPKPKATTGKLTIWRPFFHWHKYMAAIIMWRPPTIHG